MNRQPLRDELPYRPRAPRLNPLCLALGRMLGPRMLRRDHKIEAIDAAGLDVVAPLLARGDAVVLAPNHTDHADSHLLFELSRRLGRPFYYMVAYQTFRGLRGWFLPRIGAFPVDREGADLSAFKTAVEVLARATNPLVIFPEGEMYHLGDRVTPLREGAVAIATTAARRVAERGKTVWLVPVAIKYRFLPGSNPLPALHDLMDELERRATWLPRRDLRLDERIYRFAAAMLVLKEFEYLGECRRGPLPNRLVDLREHILHAVEARRLPAAGTPASVPERIKAVRRACLDVLADPATTTDQAEASRRDLHDAFVASQVYSYPGDYVRDDPTLERAADTLMKFEEDFLGVPEVSPRGPRRALARVGAPVDVNARLAALGKPRQAVPALTAELERSLQSLLDAIGPGLRIPGVPSDRPVTPLAENAASA
jgi:hypothetical protein